MYIRNNVLYVIMKTIVNLSQNKWNNTFISVIFFKNCKSCIFTIFSTKWFTPIMKKVLYYTYLENISGLAWLIITTVNKWKKENVGFKIFSSNLMPKLWLEDTLYLAWPVYGTYRTGPSSWLPAPPPPLAAVSDLLLGPGHRSTPSCSWNSASAEI